MSTAVAAWRVVVQQLEQLVAAMASSDMAAWAAAVATITQPTHELAAVKLQRAEWRTLTHAHKVPLRIASVCSKAARQDALSPVVAAASELLNTFFECAVEDVAADHPSTNATLASFMQQLQQSGISEALPDMFTAAAEAVGQLLRATKAAAAATRGGGGAAGSGGSSSSDSGGSDSQSCAVLHAASLVKTAGWLHNLQPDNFSSVASIARCVPTMMQLLLDSARLLSVHVEQHRQQGQQQPAPSDDVVDEVQALYFSSWLTLCNYAVSLCSTEDGGQQKYRAVVAAVPAVKQLLLAPAFGTGIALLVAVWVSAMLQLTEQQSVGATADASTTTSSTSSSSGSTTSSTNTTTRISSSGSTISSINITSIWPDTWQQATDMLPLLTPCHHKLSQLLGIDAQTFCWIAAVNRAYLLIRPERMFGQLNSLVAQDWIHKAYVADTPSGLSRPVPQQQLQLQCHLLQLLAATTVHGAAQQVQQQGLAASAYADALGVSGDWLGFYIDLSCTWRKQGVTVQPLGTALWLRQLLPDTLQLSARVLQSVYGSSTASSSSPAAAAPGTLDERPHKGVVHCIRRLWKILGYSLLVADLTQQHQQQHEQASTLVQQPHGSALAADDPGSSGSSSSEPSASAAAWGAAITSRDAADAWACFQEHAAAVATVLDGFVRSAAAAIAGDKALEAVAVVAEQHAALMHSLWACLGSIEDAVSPSQRIGALVKAAFSAGPDSGAMKQLLSLLRSVCKLGSVLQGFGKVGVGSVCWLHAMCAAGQLLDHPASSATVGAGAGAAAAPATIAVGVPSAVLFGYSCLLAAGQGQLRLAGAGAAGGQQQTDETSARNDLMMEIVISTDLLPPAQKVVTWLQTDSVAAELSAAGFQAQQLVEAAQQLLAALNAAAAAPDGGAGSLSTLQAALRAVGTAFTSLIATPAFCNNPVCANVAGPQELQLVNGRSCMCGGCLVARYCSIGCQHAHWKQHRRTCKALKAAAAAAAAGGGVASGGAGQQD